MDRVHLARASALALLLASAGQLAVGRTDVRRAHRALSIGFWAVVFSLLVAAAGWLTWVEAARPADLDQPMLVDAASDGRWLYVVGRTSRGGYLGFLLDAASGRHLHVDVAVPWSGLLPKATAGRDVSFSADSRWAVRWRESRGGTGLTLVDLRSEPPRPVEVPLDSSAPPSWWTHAALSRSATTVLLVQESAVSLFALPSGRAVATSPVPPGWRVGAARFLSEDAARVWLEPWEPGDLSSGPGEMRILDLARAAKPRLASFATALRSHGLRPRLLAQRGRHTTVDARRGSAAARRGDGAILATLVENAKVKAARFLADGRIAALGFESGRVVVRVFAPDGTLQERIDLDRATGERGLGPQVGPAGS